MKKSDIIAMVSAKSCIIFAAENQNTQTMKTTKKENLCRVSDRAFRTIISYLRRHRQPYRMLHRPLYVQKGSPRREKLPYA